jgi:hypothetical protein
MTLDTPKIVITIAVAFYCQNSEGSMHQVYCLRKKLGMQF